MPAGAEEGIVKGLYLLKEGAKGKGPRVQLMGSGTILREVIAAADLLRDDFKVNADIWSATSFNELRRDGMSAERWSLLHPVASRAGRATSKPASKGTPDRLLPRPTTCAASPIRCGARFRAATSCSAPMVSVAATIA